MSTPSTEAVIPPPVSPGSMALGLPPYRKRHIGDWLKGLMHGAIGAFGGFLIGALIAAIFALTTSPPTWAVAMPYVAAIGGFGFGFVEGASGD